jgi:hypothetical protein
VSGYRPEFLAALRLFAEVSGAMAVRGLPRPILVGGAAAELYSTSAITTGDFDLCSPAEEELDQELQMNGFVRPRGAGQMLKGWVHPDIALGFETVARTPMDGNARAQLVEINDDGAEIRVVSVEDLIADRMGQFASGTARDRIDQARILFQLNPSVDLEYLDRRIREESSGDYGLQDVRT